MKFLCLGYMNVDLFDSQPQAVKQAIFDQCPTLCAKMAETGKVIKDAGLANGRKTKSIRPRNGRPSVTDGPFVETKEQIGGFCIVKAANIEEAVEVVSLNPGAQLGEEFGFGMEVRPIQYEIFDRPSRKSVIKARFAKVRQWLDQIVERLTPDLMDWAPAEGMRTVSGQLVEIIGVELPLVPRMKEGKELSDEEVEAAIGDCRSLDNLKRKLVSVRQETLDYLDTLSVSELAEEVSYCGPWFGSLWLPKMPRAELFLNISEHEFYHVGQLTSYLWFRGDNPYQW